MGRHPVWYTPRTDENVSGTSATGVAIGTFHSSSLGKSRVLGATRDGLVALVKLKMRYMYTGSLLKDISCSPFNAYDASSTLDTGYCSPVVTLCFAPPLHSRDNLSGRVIHSTDSFTDHFSVRSSGLSYSFASLFSIDSTNLSCSQHIDVSRPDIYHCYCDSGFRKALVRTTAWRFGYGWGPSSRHIDMYRCYLEGLLRLFWCCRCDQEKDHHCRVPSVRGRAWGWAGIPRTERTLLLRGSSRKGRDRGSWETRHARKR